jgi:hypothetical protein
MELKNNRKEIIHSRLRKNAAKMWDIRESDTEGFDPVIDLLFSSCSSEFERLSTELNISQTRILEKVSQILLPEVNLHPDPSYAILHAKPTVPERYTDQTDQFVFAKDLIGISNKAEQKKVFFSPTSNFRLIDAEIAIMATTNEVVAVKDLLTKEPAIKSTTSGIPQRNNIWIGLRINPSLNTLKNISFYFDWINIPVKEDLLKLLPLAKLYVDGKCISIKNGFSNEVINKYKSETIDILSFLDINLKTEKKINSLFETNFITITEDILPEKNKFPSVLNGFYGVEDIKKLKEDLRWIEIELPEVFPVEYLISTFCTINAFPVLNRKFHNSNRPYTLNEDLNILPLIAEDHFFSIRDIISSNQINYQEVPFKRVSDFAPGTYTIRTHGVKRFDERDAYDNIKYLIELLREEHIAFKSMGSSLIEKELNDLEIIINRLNSNISKSGEINANTHFVIIKSEIIEDIWLEYWSTAGTFSNGIPMGSTFIHTEFEKKNLKTLVTSAGGKNPPDQMERIFMFKNELLTRNRIVTIEDIRVICFAELGNALKDVFIARGAMIIQGSNSGLQNCIHVRLKFNSGISSAEIESLIKYMKNLLEHKSSCIYKYNVENAE